MSKISRITLEVTTVYAINFNKKKEIQHTVASFDLIISAPDTSSWNICRILLLCTDCNKKLTASFGYIVNDMTFLFTIMTRFSQERKTSAFRIL